MAPYLLAKEPTFTQEEMMVRRLTQSKQELTDGDLATICTCLSVGRVTRKPVRTSGHEGPSSTALRCAKCRCSKMIKYSEEWSAIQEQAVVDVESSLACAAHQPLSFYFQHRDGTNKAGGRDFTMMYGSSTDCE